MTQIIEEIPRPKNRDVFLVSSTYVTCRAVCYNSRPSVSPESIYLINIPNIESHLSSGSQVLHQYYGLVCVISNSVFFSGGNNGYYTVWPCLSVTKVKGSTLLTLCVLLQAVKVLNQRISWHLYFIIQIIKVQLPKLSLLCYCHKLNQIFTN